MSRRLERRLSPGEASAWTVPSNLVTRWRSVGGDLVMTNSHLWFFPRFIDAALGSKPWSTRLADVRSVAVEHREARSTIAGGFGALVTRVVVSLTDGTVQRFVVRDAVAIADRIDEATSDAGH